MKIFYLLRLCYLLNILSVNEKLPVSKFRYFAKYIMQRDGYFYVRVSGKRQASLNKKKKQFHEPWNYGARVHVLFVFFAVFESLKASFK